MDISQAFMQDFEAFVEQHKLIQPRDCILVGFSGGPDSTALLQALSHLRPKYQINLLAAHVNYGLRGADSDADERFVTEFCFARNINIVSKKAQLPHKGNLQSHARDVRSQWFGSLCKPYRVQKIALGHNRNDQAETVLLRLIRGAATSGMKGILPHAGSVIHPLLPFSRQRLEGFLESEGLSWRTDSSNAETKYSRNRIRHELLPWIRDNMNPDIVDRLYETAQVFAQTDEVLNQLVLHRLQKHSVVMSDDQCKLPLQSVRNLSPVLRFYLYRSLYAHLNGDEKDFYGAHFDRIEQILDAAGSKYINLPGDIVAVKQYDDLLFCRADSLSPVDAENNREISTLRNRLLFDNYRISMKKIKKLPTRHSFENRHVAYMDFDKVTFPLTLRHRQQGDRFIPFGMKHHKKLHDFLIDEKVPRFDRDKLVIIEDAEKIIWVCGMRVDQRVAVDDNTRSILMVSADRVASSRPRSAERKK
ncbi:MAG: tRNA lysidine(34) synthetase TilS [Candidatus Cloacimonetes bacterium]|nr:tRNA lysidine(34) synthetase TilS [Candidatus Cloacimonadota bacterium]